MDDHRSDCKNRSNRSVAFVSCRPRSASSEGRDAKVDASHAASLDELIGTKEWREAFIEERDERDLFGPKKEHPKIATPESITRFMIKRMKGVFKGGVLEEWLPLGSRGIHMYSLLFA